VAMRAKRMGALLRKAVRKSERGWCGYLGRTGFVAAFMGAVLLDLPFQAGFVSKVAYCVTSGRRSKGFQESSRVLLPP
jgi:hypothetical protein